MSPFSQKVRAMLGYTGTQWRSVVVDELPPRKELNYLTGGYRRVPVAQVGSDIFCDSNLICDEIATFTKHPELSILNVSWEDSEFIHHLETTIFYAVASCAATPKESLKVVLQKGPLQAAKLMIDRTRLALEAEVRVAEVREYKNTLLEHYDDLENRLSEPFLGGKKPSIIDFSAYLGTWFVCDWLGTDALEKHPSCAAWHNRMRTYGIGDHEKMTSSEALMIARNQSPRLIPKDARADIRVGKMVNISPADYGIQPITGTLAGVTQDRWILAQGNERTGRMHVHFPSDGYSIQVIE